MIGVSLHGIHAVLKAAADGLPVPGESMVMIETRHPLATSQPGSVPFQAHVELLQGVLAQREAIVAQIERLLNCQKKTDGYQQDAALLSRLFKDGIFLLPGVSREQSALRDQLEHAHWAGGFKPRATPGNDLVDPAQMMVRAFHLWRQTRWPGQKGRVRYAHTLFNLYLIRCLTLLTMRLWDEAPGGVGARLAQTQALLDQLWQDAPADQPRLVHDVCWLIPVAISPTTDDLSGYFAVATRITDTFAEADQLVTLQAWVSTGAGHLRAQLRHLAAQQNMGLDEHSLVLITRKSNALDVALLVQGLVTLFEAYERCMQNGDEQQRHALAAVIYQGVSPDPVLFLNRLDLLKPYSMIEHLFITTDDTGQVVYTAAGERHRQLLQRYEALVERLAQPLYDDRQHCQPIDDGYSPYGALYGFSANLIELIAFKTLQREAVASFSIEDVFSAGGADKRAWVNGWRNLPHVKPEVLRQFEYPRQFVADISARIEQALQHRIAANTTAPCGRLLIVPGDVEATLAQVPEVPLCYRLSSDPRAVAAGQAEVQGQDDLLHCRLEGEFLVSYQTAEGWMALDKDLLTDIIGAGRDARLAGLPRVATGVLRLMCPELVVVQPG